MPELIDGGTPTQWRTKYTVGKMNKLQLQATRMNPWNTLLSGKQAQKITRSMIHFPKAQKLAKVGIT